MPSETQIEWLRSVSTGKPMGVDRDKGIIHGYVMAERGPFKNQSRGEFDDRSLAMIVELSNAKPNGLKSRFAHPTLSGDGLGKFLGRAKNARLDGAKVRGDLHLDRTSRNTPSGDLGGYVMDLAESDPESFGSSLVLQTKKVVRLDKNGRPQLDDAGDELPPLWYPERIHASDIVDDGDAVHGGFLSSDAIDADELPDAFLWHGSAMLDQMFSGKSRDFVNERLTAWLSRYLDRRYGQKLTSDGCDLLRRKLSLTQKGWNI